jgi:hypothetical protein
MKYNQYHHEKSKPKNREPHPIWRGIGFIMIVLIPLMGYGISLLLLQANRENGWMAIPRDLIARGADPDLYLKIILTIALSFVLYVVFTFFSVVVLRAFGPPRYGPTDVPPITTRMKKRY